MVFIVFLPHLAYNPKLIHISLIKANIGTVVNPVVTAPCTQEVVKKTSAAASSDSPDVIMARTVVENPQKYIKDFVVYWSENLPDLSEGRPPAAKDLMFWKNLCGNLTSHTEFPGLCAKWMHIAIDFAIATDEMPVRFVKNGQLYDMVIPFVLKTWVCYAAQMNGSPDLTSKACQKVLEYMVTQPAKVVKSWRKRSYFYASATIFREVCGPLSSWLRNKRDDVEDHDRDFLKRKQMLRRLADEGDLHKLVGDAILLFIQKKRAPFPGALLSKKHFLEFAAWKRAFIFVKLVRELTGQHANKHWNKFGYENWKLNKRLFRTFCEKDDDIWKVCPLFQKLPDTFTPPASSSTSKETATPRRKQRTRKRFELSSPEGKTPKKIKTICLISDSDEEDWVEEA